MNKNSTALTADAQREHGDHRQGGEGRARQAADAVAQIGEYGLDAAAAARVARFFLDRRDVAEFAAGRRACRVWRHAFRHEPLDCPVQVRGHLFLHLALEARAEEDRTEPQPGAPDHVTRRIAVSAPEKRFQASR